MEPIKFLSGITGASDPALRLLISILLSYPISWFYTCYVRSKTVNPKNVFLAASGIVIGLFNFGFGVRHSVYAVLFSYGSSWVLGPTKINVILNLIFHMGYLIIGYWTNDFDSYEITWTMPHCVLTLRLIGLSQDLWDGAQDYESLSSANKKSAIRSRLQILELFAYAFFPASYLVGPQFSLKRLKDFVNEKFENNLKPSKLVAGSQRGLVGLCYLIAYQIGNAYLDESYFLTQAFMDSSILWKHFILAAWLKIFFMKYISCWLLTEGACITFGLAYNGQSDDETAVWDGCRNINLGIYEGIIRFGQYVDCFNVNTNAWVAQYVYKRMAFLGNRVVSQAITLIFLAVWHGLHSGYYMAFFMQFTMILLEKDLEKILYSNKAFTRISQYKAFIIVSLIVRKIYVSVFIGYAIIPFALLSFSKWWLVYKSLYFSGFVLFFPWAFVYKPFVKNIFGSKKSKEISNLKEKKLT